MWHNGYHPRTLTRGVPRPCLAACSTGSPTSASSWPAHSSGWGCCRCWSERRGAAADPRGAHLPPDRRARAPAGPYYDPVISATPESFRAQMRIPPGRYRVIGTRPGCVASSGRPRGTPEGRPCPDHLRRRLSRQLRDGPADPPRARRAGDVLHPDRADLDEPRLPWWDHVACAVKRTRVPRLRLDRNPGDPRPIDIDAGDGPGRRSADGRRSCGSSASSSTGRSPTGLVPGPARRAGGGRRSTPQALGRELFMGWDQVKQLADAGMAVGSHGHSHVALGEPRRRRAAPRAGRARRQILERGSAESHGPRVSLRLGGLLHRAHRRARRRGRLPAGLLIPRRRESARPAGIRAPGPPPAERRHGRYPALLRARASLHAALGRSFL